ncbi:MAG: hypothetical protein WAV20_12925 [Blastocatellia bacterium]
MLDLFAVSVVLIRVLAILLIVNATAAILATIVFIRQSSSTGEFSDSTDIPVVAALLTHLVLAAVLLIFSRKLGRLVTRGLEYRRSS